MCMCMCGPGRTAPHMHTRTAKTMEMDDGGGVLAYCCGMFGGMVLVGYCVTTRRRCVRVCVRASVCACLREFAYVLVV